MNHIALTDSQRRTLLLAENFLLLVLVGAGGLLGNWIATTTAGGQYAVIGALVGGGVTLVFGQTANSLVHEVVAGQMLDPLAIIQLLLQNATNQVAQAIVPQTQASISMTVPPSATGSDSTTITATAGDTSASPPPNPIPLPNWIGPSPEPVPLPNWVGPSPEPSPVDAPGPVTSGDAAPSSVAVEPVRFVMDDAGNRYQLVPAPGV